MAFLKSNWSICSTGHAETSSKVWNYKTSDTEATVEASGYFNSVAGHLSVGDFINVYYSSAADANILRVATNDGTTVTTADLLSYGSIELAQGYMLRGSATGIAEALQTNELGKTLVGNGTTVVADKLGGNSVKIGEDNSQRGGLVTMFRADLPGGATLASELTMTNKVRIFDVWVINKGAGTTSDTLTVGNGANPITNAINISGADKTIARPTTIDDAYWTIEAGNSIRFTETDGGGNDSPPVTVLVFASPVS